MNLQPSPPFKQLYSVALSVFLLLPLFLLFPLEAHARLGETETALEKRFGEPISSLPKDKKLSKPNQERISVRIYNIGPNKNGALLEVTFLDGVSRQEFYYLETEKSKVTPPWNENQVQYILEVNAEGSSWSDLTPGEAKEGKKWKRKDTLATASFHQVKPRVNLVESLPIRSELLVWSGFEVSSTLLRDFFKQTEEDNKIAQKLQESEIQKKSQQELSDRAALPGI